MHNAKHYIEIFCFLLDKIFLFLECCALLVAIITTEHDVTAVVDYLLIGSHHMNSGVQYVTEKKKQHTVIAPIY